MRPTQGPGHRTHRRKKEVEADLLSRMERAGASRAASKATARASHSRQSGLMCPSLRIRFFALTAPSSTRTPSNRWTKSVCTKSASTLSRAIRISSRSRPRDQPPSSGPSSARPTPAGTASSTATSRSPHPHTQPHSFRYDATQRPELRP